MVELQNFELRIKLLNRLFKLFKLEASSFNVFLGGRKKRKGPKEVRTRRSNETKRSIDSDNTLTRPYAWATRPRAICMRQRMLSVSETRATSSLT